MPTCFVIQPFDGGKYDKRFDQVFKPAIEKADLIPYRVDQDAKVEVPIEAIEDGIRDAAICLADITTSNPNVWYELGYAMALGKPVVMVCSEEREKYPFDIQHRTVISYKSDAPEDFTNLETTITTKIKALLQKGETLRQIANADPVASVSGLAPHELTLLATVAGNVDAPDSWVSLYVIKNEAEREFLTPIGTTLALRRLTLKKLLEVGSDSDRHGDDFDAVRVTEEGWMWIDQNESRFVIRRGIHEESSSSKPVRSLPDFEDIPY